MRVVDGRALERLVERGTARMRRNLRRRRSARMRESIVPVSTASASGDAQRGSR